MPRPAPRLALAAALVAAAAPLAHASPPATLLAAGGRALRVGSVVATGRLDGDVCRFPGGTAVTVRTRATAGVRLTADDACRLVVTSTDEGTDLGAARPYNTQPKTDTSSVDPASWAVIHGQVPVPDGSLPEIDASRTSLIQVVLSQTVYNAAGSMQYEDRMDVAYVKNNRDGGLSALEPVDGYCKAGSEGEVLEGFADVITTEIRDCFYQPKDSGPDRVGFFTGGYYRQVFLGYERDSRMLTERFEERRDGWLFRSCDTGGALGRGWSTYCFLNRVE